jgi:hypothetical protein
LRIDSQADPPTDDAYWVSKETHPRYLASQLIHTGKSIDECKNEYALKCRNRGDRNNNPLFKKPGEVENGRVLCLAHLGFSIFASGRRTMNS